MAQGVRSVTVRLRSGISDATLPNNVRMRPRVNYAISLRDYRKLSRDVRESIVSVVSMNTSETVVPLWNGSHYALDLTTINNTASLPSAGGKTFQLGEVVQGFNGSAFKLVKLAGSGSVNATATVNVAVWYDKSKSEVSVNTSADTGDFAGVFIGAVTKGNYGWIQTEGVVINAGSAAGVAAGEPVAVSTASNGQFTAPGTNEVQTITPGGTITGGTWNITFNGYTTSNLAYNATAAQVQAALEALPSIGTGNILVTGGPLTSGPFTLTFVVDLGYMDVPQITLTNNLTGTSPTITAATTTQGVAHSPNSIGTALTDVASNLVDVSLRSAAFANRHFKTAKLFLDKND